MRYAIVESGGKQYRVVEGGTLDVDRLPVETGKNLDLENILLMADGDEVIVGTPTVSGIQVQATVLAHVKGPKVVSFKYRPKKRIRVKGGHRQQYTRLMVNFIGKPGEERKMEKAEAPVAAEAAAPIEQVEKPAKKATPVKKAATTTKSTASKKPATTTKKTTRK
jgi:large subunit ribosomal protein L21